MPRIALLEPPDTDQVGALLAGMMPGEAPPIGLFRMFARSLPMAGAMREWGRYESLTFAERVGLTHEQATSLVHGGPADECRTAGPGWYHAVGFAARTARIPNEPGAPRFADFPPRTR
ncbi:hypothetical protein ACIBU0_08960 [Streptomyces sp. NPDC049627]|uniref:hypothetical protein n=1 Tax=Streptomyces sp. NPDC049627 TaxID=3365595 RepID=UPI0037A61221